MYDTEIERRILEFLEGCCNGTSQISQELKDEFGEACKKILDNNLLETRQGEEFRLRMSNIGRDLRQLHLEKEYGKQPLSTQSKLKFTYGALIEALMLVILKASGVQIKAQSGKCSLTVSKTELKGEFDLDIDDKIYDVKSASPFSYENKFKTLETLIDGDEFGYISQLVGYSSATGKGLGGWIVINKVDGSIKVLEANLNKEQVLTAKRSILNTVKHFEEARPMPPCQGVVSEFRYKTPTGNKILSRSCEYCDCKFKCHPGLKALPDVNSTAASPKIKYYVELNNVPSPDGSTGKRTKKSKE